MTKPLIYTHINQTILTIKINRANKYNALTIPMFSDLTDAINKGINNASVNAILISAEGTNYCAGHDLNEFKHWPQNKQDPVPTFLHTLANINKPLIMAVQGHAIGIGATMLLHADYVLATTSAIFRMPFIDLKIVPEAASSLLLAQTIGLQRAKKILLTNHAITASNAYEWGLITEVCEEEQLQTLAIKRAEMLAQKDGTSYRNIKALMLDKEAISQKINLEIDLINKQVASTVQQN